MQIRMGVNRFLPITVVCAVAITAFLLLVFWTAPDVAFGRFSQGKSAHSLPLNFENCQKLHSKNILINSDVSNIPFCDYSVEANDPLFQQCISRGGKSTKEICMTCPGCGCVPGGCTLTFLNPDFTLPATYAECSKVFPHAGGRNAGDRNGKNFCVITVPKQGVGNIKDSENLLTACFRHSGSSFGENGSCELRFYED